MIKYKFFFYLLGMTLLYSCGPHSSEEFQKEGEAQCLSLITTLQTIETTDRLLQMEPELKKKFESLVTLMIEASRFQQEYSDDGESRMAFKSSFVSDSLKEQLHRIYLIEGGRGVIERSQHESLVKLDAYERSRLKQREKLKT